MRRHVVEVDAARKAGRHLENFDALIKKQPSLGLADVENGFLVHALCRLRKQAHSR